MGLDNPAQAKILYKHMDMTKVNLDAPAFGPGSQIVADLSEEKKQPEPEQKEEQVEKEEVAAKETAESDEEAEEPKRVTYSRFKNVHNRATEAETRAERAEREAQEARQEAATWRAKAEQIKPNDSVNDGDTTLPSWWIELYGDSEPSQRAWKVQSKANAELQERLVREAQDKALEAIRNQQVEEQRRLAENTSTIDTNLEQLEAFVGRELTEKEQLSVLNIVDEFTPKDDEGNYLGSPIPFEKAWEIHELKNQALKAPKAQARDAVAAINGSSSQGDPSAEEEKNRNFNPSWSSVAEAIRRRLPS